MLGIKLGTEEGCALLQAHWAAPSSECQHGVHLEHHWVPGWAPWMEPLHKQLWACHWALLQVQQRELHLDPWKRCWNAPAEPALEQWLSSECAVGELPLLASASLPSMALCHGSMLDHCSLMCCNQLELKASGSKNGAAAVVQLMAEMNARCGKQLLPLPGTSCEGQKGEDGQLQGRESH